jgi:alpha-ribazole phosphatase
MILHLVRHPPVTKTWQARCYGQSDPGLSRAGQAMVAPLMEQLAALRPDAIIHSDMKRTRPVAMRLADKLGIAPISAPQWRERDFGNWEGRSWNAIYRETGNAMDGMINDPEYFRPGGGETTRALLNRIYSALMQLPGVGSIAIISHGGPIACTRMIFEGLTVDQLAEKVPLTGEIISLGFVRKGLP